MKYKVLKNCVINRNTAKVGDIVEIDSDQESRALLGIGRIAPHDETATADRSIGLSEETKPKRRGRPKKVVEPEIFDLVDDDAG